MEPAFHHWFPQNGAWTALKPPPNVLKNPHEPAFHPWVLPKRSLDSPKTIPNQKKKKSRKNKKEFPKKFRTLQKMSRCLCLSCNFHRHPRKTSGWNPQKLLLWVDVFFLFLWGGRASHGGRRLRAEAGKGNTSQQNNCRLSFSKVASLVNSNMMKEQNGHEDVHFRQKLRN